MLNQNNFARPESTLPTDGVYVPTQEDWTEVCEYWEASERADELDRDDRERAERAGYETLAEEPDFYHFF